MSKILIVAEQAGGKLRSSSRNAVSLGQKLGQSVGGGELIGLVIGSNVEPAANELAQYGLNKVLFVDAEPLAQYAAETHASVVANVARAIGATYVCATATSTGKDLMPRVTALLDTAMVSDVSEVVEPKRFKRPMVAGNAIGVVEIDADLVVVTARQTEWAQAEPSGQTAPVERAEAGAFDALGATIESLDLTQSDRPDLAEATVVVSGGKGMKTEENFKQIEALADALGAAVGATRAACDAGLVPNALQVGQTGKVVAPDLYIAVGISGAIQHLAGMKKSKTIVAINKDPEAPIFQIADYALVATWENTLPELTEKVRAARQSQ